MPINPYANPNPYQQPVTYGQAGPLGPQMPLQWQQIGNQNQQQDTTANIGGLADLLKRFKRPPQGGMSQSDAEGFAGAA